MRDERSFREFSTERGAALRRQALLLTGDPARGDALAECALADTARRWDRIVAGGPAATEEHARRAVATGALRRRASRAKRRGRVGLVDPPAVNPGRSYRRGGRGPMPAPRTPVGPVARPAAPPGAGEPLNRSGTGIAAATPVTPASPDAAPAGQEARTDPPAGQEARTDPPAGQEARTDPPPGAAVEESDSDAAWRALAALPPRRRAVLVLRYDEGLDDAAIGARLGMPPAAVAAEGEAGLGALRSLLRRRGRPEQLVPPALADPARDRDLPTPARPLADAALERSGRDRHRRRVGLATAGTAAVVVAAAVLVPVALSGDDPPAGELPAAAPGTAGLLDWPARGPLAGDHHLLRAALAAWRAGVPEPQAPAGAAVLYAGSPDGPPMVLLQGVDPAGLGWVAELAGAPGGGTPELRRTEPIGRAAPVLALSTSDARRVRLLAPADSPRDGGLLVRPADRADGAALRRLPLDADGLSEPVELGRDGIAVVVLRGSGADAVVAGSGRVGPGRINPLSGHVELGSARLAFGRTTDVRSDWYADGELIAGALDGPVSVAAVGPELTGTAGGGPVRARTYEVQHAGDTWISSVVRVGPTACVDGSRLGTVQPGGDVPVVVRRCAPAGAAAGVLHVLAGREVASVQVRLRPGGRGQREVRLTVRRGAAGVLPAGDGFTALVPVSALPTGSALVLARDGAGREIIRVPLRPYRAPRA